MHVEEAIERYFEGRAGKPEDRDALFGHLDRCDACRSRFDQLARVHRALGGGEKEGELPATELALIGASVISAEPVRARKPLGWLLAVLAPVAALVLLLPRSELTSKGGGSAGSPAIEVLCFDENAELRTHLSADGECPAPGFVKLVYASAGTVPALYLAALSDGEVRMSTKLTRPEPRSVISDYAALKPGESLRIIAVETDREISFEEASAMKPALTVLGVAK